MQTAFFTSFCIIAILLGAQLWLRPLLVSKSWLFLKSSIAIIFFVLLRESHLFFIKGVTNPDFSARLFFPPYQNASTLLLRLWNQFWLFYSISLLVALLFLIVIYSTKKEWRDLRFERYEPPIIALGIFLTGHPFWILYIFLTALLYLIYTAFVRLKTKQNLRVSFALFWLPAALLTLALLPLLKDLPLFRMLSVFQVL